MNYFMRNFFEILCGDFKAGTSEGEFCKEIFYLNSDAVFQEKIRANEIETLETLSDEVKHSVGQSTGSGLVYGLLMGPIGFLIGSGPHRRYKGITFVCRFKDGRKFTAIAPTKLYNQIVASQE
jgi:hypothetical protein